MKTKASRILALASIVLLLSVAGSQVKFAESAGEEVAHHEAHAAAIAAKHEQHAKERDVAAVADASGAAAASAQHHHATAAEHADAEPHSVAHTHTIDHEKHAAGKIEAPKAATPPREPHAHGAADSSERENDAESSGDLHRHSPRRAGPSASASSSSSPMPASSSHDHHAPTTQESRYPGGCEPRVPTGNHPLEFSIRCLSPSVALAPGQVVNVNLLFESPFPADVAVAIGTQTTQLVSAGSQEPVPADDVYMHHFVTPDTLLVPPPTGQGNVTRASFYNVDGDDVGVSESKSSKSSPHPFSLVVPKGHYRRDARRATNMHLISTVGVGSDTDRLPKLMCVECRCPEEFGEGVSFKRSVGGAGLPTGGVICCRDCEAPNAVDRTPRHYQLRYDTIYRELPQEQEEGEAEEKIAPVRLARVDGARGVGERIEYEVPRHPEGKQHVSTYDFTLNDLLEGSELSEPVVLLRCDGHQHMGGECLSILDAATSELVCESCPSVGKSPGVVGDELDYVVSMSTVDISPAKAIAPDAPLRMISKYSAVERHTGVMSIMFLYYSEDSGRGYSVSEINAAAEAKDASAANAAAQVSLAVDPSDFAALFPRALSYTTPECGKQLWQVWANCPPAAASSKAEENAVVCCSMTGALAASRCTCDVVPHAETELLTFLTDWQAQCTTAMSAWDAYALACHDDGSRSRFKGWKWSNLLAFIGADDQLRSLFGDGELMRLLVLLSWGVPVLVMFLAWIVHRVASSPKLSFSADSARAYCSLPESEQYVCLSHLVSATLFSLQLVPLTYQGVKVLFGPNFQENAGGTTVPFLIGITYSHAAIYLAEGIYRGTARSNWLLMSHHVLFFSLAPVMIKYMSMLAFKTAMTVDMFVTFEAGLFALLVARRLGADARKSLALGRVSIGLYAASRVAQTVILFSLFRGSRERVGHTPAYWMLAFVAGSLTVIQTFTFFIYSPILGKLKAEVESGGGGGSGGGGVVGAYTLTSTTSTKGVSPSNNAPNGGSLLLPPPKPPSPPASSSSPSSSLSPSPSSSPDSSEKGGVSGNGVNGASQQSLRRVRLGSASSATSLNGGSDSKKW